MSPLVRIAALVAVLGCGSAFAWWVASGGDGAPAKAASAVRFQSAAECRDCHRQVWDEWFGSHHQIAYLNPEVQKLSDDFRNKECQACHLPRPVAETGYGLRVLPRQAFPDEGVSCLTCHLGSDGTILARNDAPDAPCRPRASRELVSVELCASCHNQHETTDQWRASAYPAEGRDCNHCHMPATERRRSDGSTGPGRGHVYPGAHDAATLRAAGRFTARVDGDALLLALENTGAGHNFPTEERHRAVDIMVRFVMADGSTDGWQRAYRFRQPYRDEPGEDTQLPAGATKAVELGIPAGAVRATARLWYRLTPFVDDDDPKSTLLCEHELELR